MKKDRKKQNEAIKQKVAGWPSSGLSQRVYCEQENIPFHSFKYWRQRQRSIEKKATTPVQNKGFVPLSLQTTPKPSSRIPASIELEYPNGVKLRLESQEVSLLKTLISLY